MTDKTKHAPAGSQDLLVRRTDLEAVCKAIEEGSVRYTYNDNGPSGYECVHCSGWLHEYSEKKLAEMTHDLNCPVLVARDIRPRKLPNTPTATLGGAE